MRKVASALLCVILCCSLILTFVSCSGKSSNFSIDGAEIDNDAKTISLNVDSDVTTVDLNDKVVVKNGATWNLYLDVLAQNVVKTKIAASSTGELAFGDNTFYIVFEKGNKVETYELHIYREPYLQLVYYKGTEELKRESFKKGDTLTLDPKPNIGNYTFEYWMDKNGNKLESGKFFESVDAYAKYSDKIYPAYTGTCGAVAPSGVTPTYAISSTMTAGEMFEAAVNNYRAADYAAYICIAGGFDGKIGPISISQTIQSFKVRDGRESDSNVKYYGYNRTGGLISVYEDYYRDSTGIKYRNANNTKKYNTQVTMTNGLYRDFSFVTAKTYNDVVEYASKAELYTNEAIDYESFLPYYSCSSITNNDSAVIYDAENGTYSFSIILDVNSINGNINPLIENMSKKSGMSITKYEYKTIELKCVVYSNGFFKYIAVNEVIDITAENTGLGNAVDMNDVDNRYVLEYSFDRAEKLPYHSYNGSQMKTSDFDYDTVTGDFINNHNGD